MQAIKSVKQNYQPSESMLDLLEQFRRIVNDCIRIGLNENISSVKSLSLRAYHQLSSYSVPTYYRLTAISKATGILRNYRKVLRKKQNTKGKDISLQIETAEFMAEKTLESKCGS